MDKFKEKLRQVYGGKYQVAYWETRPHKESGDDVIYVGLSKADLTLTEACELPAEIDGVGVVYEYVGEITPLFRNYHNPLIGGVSIGAKDVTAGTHGGVVWKSGKPFFITNEHVVSNTSNTDPAHPPRGHRILQPGVADGGKKTVGYLEAVGGMKEAAMNGQPCNIDAALIRPGRDFLKNRYAELGNVADVVHRDARVGDQIVKAGRTTGVTFAEVGAVDVSANIGGIAWSEPVVMEGLIKTKRSFVQGGDSGSRVWEVDSMQPIGLVFAGSWMTSMIIPAETICQKFNVIFGDKKPGEIAPPQRPESWLMRFFRAVWSWIKNITGGI